MNKINEGIYLSDLERKSNVVEIGRIELDFLTPTFKVNFDTLKEEFKIERNVKMIILSAYEKNGDKTNFSVTTNLSGPGTNAGNIIYSFYTKDFQQGYSAARQVMSDLQDQLHETDWANPVDKFLFENKVIKFQDFN